MRHKNILNTQYMFPDVPYRSMFLTFLRHDNAFSLAHVSLYGTSLFNKTPLRSFPFTLPVSSSITRDRPTPPADLLLLQSAFQFHFQRRKQHRFQCFLSLLPVRLIFMSIIFFFLEHF